MWLSKGKSRALFRNGRNGCCATAVLKRDPLEWKQKSRGINLPCQKGVGAKRPGPPPVCCSNSEAWLPSCSLHHPIGFLLWLEDQLERIRGFGETKSQFLARPWRKEMSSRVETAKEGQILARKGHDMQAWGWEAWLVTYHFPYQFLPQVASDFLSLGTIDIWGQIILCCGWWWWGSSHAL